MVLPLLPVALFCCTAVPAAPTSPPKTVVIRSVHESGAGTMRLHRVAGVARLLSSAGGTSDGAVLVVQLPAEVELSEGADVALASGDGQRIELTYAGAQTTVVRGDSFAVRYAAVGAGAARVMVSGEGLEGRTTMVAP